MCEHAYLLHCQVSYYSLVPGLLPMLPTFRHGEEPGYEAIIWYLSDSEVSACLHINLCMYLPHMQVEGDEVCSKSEEDSRITGIMHKACLTYHYILICIISCNGHYYDQYDFGHHCTYTNACKFWVSTIVLWCMCNVHVIVYWCTRIMNAALTLVCKV